MPWGCRTYMPVTPSPPYFKVAFFLVDPINKKQYRKYLKSGKWKSIRKNLFKLRGKKCELCGSRKKIHVHHLTYKRVGGNELPEDLQVLCEFHHNIAHGMSEKKQIRYIKREEKKRRKREKRKKLKYKIKRKKETDMNLPCWHYTD